MELLYGLLFFNIGTLLTSILLPGLIIFGIVYWKRYQKIKRKKFTVIMFSLLGPLVTPFSLYLIGYYSSHGWKNGTAEIFMFFIFGYPVIFLVLIIAFLIMTWIKQRVYTN